MKYDDTVILVFAKAPIAGRVNTRLIPDIGVEQATQLQHEWIIDRISGLSESSLAQLCLFCAPDTTHEIFQQCKSSYDIGLYQQTGADLGNKMYNGVCWAIQHYECCIVIGTDAPALTTGQIDEAIETLRQGYDCVYKPAQDGGYVLAGYTSVWPELFNDIDWGTDAVMRQIRTKLDDNSINYQLLSPGWDVDQLEDYQRYLKLHEPNA